MSAASYFEAEIRLIVEAFVSRASNANAAVIGLVKNKAIERQFHTFFSWKERNANLFFSLFGEVFSKHCREQVRIDGEVTEAIAAFMELGETRNKLAHLNFGAFPVEKTSAEIYGLYQRAVPFLAFVRKKLVDESGIPPGSSPAPSGG
jgi:RiboL-PSP-HEPN